MLQLGATVLCAGPLVARQFAPVLWPSGPLFAGALRAPHRAGGGDLRRGPVYRRGEAQQARDGPGVRATRRCHRGCAAGHFCPRQPVARRLSRSLLQMSRRFHWLPAVAGRPGATQQVRSASSQLPHLGLRILCRVGLLAVRSTCSCRLHDRLPQGCRPLVARRGILRAHNGCTTNCRSLVCRQSSRFSKGK